MLLYAMKDMIKTENIKIQEYVKDGSIVKIESDNHDPVNQPNAPLVTIYVAERSRPAAEIYAFDTGT